MNNNRMINETQKVKYQVKLDGAILTEAQSEQLASNFVSTLAPEQQARVQIVPVVEGGQQLLFENNSSRSFV